MKRCACLLGLALWLVGCKGKPVASEGSTSAPQTAATPAKIQPVQPSVSTLAAAVPNARGGPHWDWQKFDEESFETQPSQGRVFAVPENASRLRVKLVASSPVDAAAMPRSVFKSAKGVVREDRLVRLPCASIGVRQDEPNCSLDPKDSIVYVVRDRRALSADPVAMARLQKQAERRGNAPAMMAPDKVHVVLFVWACVANCGPLGGPAQ